MKISHSVRDLYEEQFEVNQKLKVLVDEKLKALKEERWHYESRLKLSESFALKIETGRAELPSMLEDFLGCTLVVENRSSLRKAEKLIRTIFELKERRPRSEKKTSKKADSFPFDDLRLYVKWKDDPALRPSSVNGIVFEVQIKTFLQHAWSIATHDLIYKSDNVSWAKERIAYQVKAMLEHAEISIHEAEQLSTSSVLDRINKQTENLLKAIDLLKELWAQPELPVNIVVLAKNTKSLMEALGMNLNTLKYVLGEETKNGRGIKTLNLSPYGIVVQSLINREPKRLFDYLSSDSGTFRILIPQEIVIPDDIDKGLLKNAIFI